MSFSKIQAISSCTIKLIAFLFAANLLYGKDVPYCNWTALQCFALEGQSPYIKKEKKKKGLPERMSYKNSSL